jgi:SAM-dependent methyltransferase
VSELEAKLRAVGAMWGGADYERIAARLAPIHDRLVTALHAQPDEHWLDLATGTGEVALRAARRGAVVTGVDISERLLELARAKADAEGLSIDWALADVQRLPFEDEAFEVLSSAFGVIFAPDRQAVARELGRLCRLHGRLGLTTWVPDEEFDRLWKPFVDEPPPSEPDAWGDPAALRTLLGGDFDLVVEPEEWVLEAESIEAIWDLFTSATPPFKALYDSLEPERQDEMRRVFFEVHERYSANGSVRVPREYLLVLGRRR